MATYNNNFTDELRARLSIVDVVGKRVPLTKKGQNFWGCCPFHNEKTPSFSVNEEKGFYHCFGCGEHGDIISFTMKSNNMDFKAAIAELAQMAGVKMPDYKPKSPDQVKREENYISITEAATKLFQDKLFSADGAHALEYVRKRGFSDDVIKKYRLGYAPKNNIIANKFVDTKFETLSATGMVRRGDYGNYDFFRDKLMFPIFNVAGQVIAFSGRSLDGSEPKYINTVDTELFHKRKSVFGLNFARDAIYRNNRAIVVEGQIDAIMMQVAGFGETVAPLGTALTEDHIAILCKLNRNITFCFDGDGAGQKAAARACGIVLPFMRDNSEIKFAFMPKGSDPDDVLKSGGVDAMKKIIDAAVPIVDYLWDLTNTGYVISTPGGRTQAEKFLKKELEKIKDPDLKREFEQEYNSRKFNQWHRWKKGGDVTAKIAVPNIDAITTKTLCAIVEQYPDLAERHGEFLSTLNISFDGSADKTTLSTEMAEKFIVSLKLKKYLEKLAQDKKELTNKLLSGDESVRTAIDAVDAEIKKSTERLDILISVQ